MTEDRLPVAELLAKVRDWVLRFNARVPQRDLRQR